MYKINDVVVYKRDVCRVVGREKSGFTGEKCYILVPYHNTDGSTRMELIKETPELELLTNKPANMKSQYANLLKTNEITDLIRIIKTSYERNRIRMEQHKKAASVDDEYLQKAEGYLYNELSVVLGMSFEEAKEYFTEEVSKVDS